MLLVAFPLAGIAVGGYEGSKDDVGQDDSNCEERR